jgi:hypothetical protein
LEEALDAVGFEFGFDVAGFAFIKEAVAAGYMEAGALQVLGNLTHSRPRDPHEEGVFNIVET